MSAWSCAEAQDRLDDFVDGLLDGGERERLEAHLAQCDACRKDERRLRALLAAAARLPAEVAPPQDLWPGIERRLHTGSAAAWPGYLAAAACVALAVAGLVTARTPRAGDLTAAGGAAAGTLQPAALQAADMEQVERDYERAAAALLVRLQARQAELPPETVEQVQQSLRTIDTALDQIRAALREAPAEPALHLMLAATHRKKVEVLRRVVEVGA